ncbi:DNA mismatch repair protein MutS [Desulfosporosinus sp. PR]|uniref:MutS-related protein n=1 Tax=Candidatus Desulfosporosinus nitrosoreducens TaxID=3401928 RepID=UPI0027E70941|nr:DNA mismatch repair protein MutS [Desulfosporosinus sp. PR]MDQ7096355.1 DNA mismatch repair protein MutS [Desulfosporosinus sp. PR]
MTFQSILFARPEDRITKESLEAPGYFEDLNLDQVIEAITVGKQDYHLKPYFYTCLHDADAIKYRQEIMLDLENTTLFKAIKSFAQKMTTMREHLAQAQKLYYKYQQESWFLDAVEIYCQAVSGLVEDLNLHDLKSRGFLAYRDYLENYVQSAGFKLFLKGMEKLKGDLASVHYCLLLKGNSIKVGKYNSEIDYSADVERTFEKFKQGAVKDYKVNFSSWVDMNHVEGKILELVAQLYPDIFLCLDRYCSEHRDFLDETIGVFDREVQFYISYLEYIATFKGKGLKFCYPQVFDNCKEIYDYEGFDLALANKFLSQNDAAIVCNDFYLKDKERIFVVSGPNQGGKTTFARTFGQLHYLACLGCPVPGREARLFLFDSLFTHFEKEENIKNLRGKLQDDLVRIYAILNQATANSIIIMNEIFTSTTLQDAIFLGERVMEKIIQLDSLCVCVTFIDELAFLGEKTVSLVSTVVPGNPALRTYKIVRRPADGLSYSLPIVQKYRLTYEWIKERIK